jgi:flagellar motor switch protein FliM
MSYFHKEPKEFSSHEPCSNNRILKKIEQILEENWKHYVMVTRTITNVTNA